MAFSEQIFRANDIRGLLSEITEELAFGAAYALVKKTGAKTVVIGRDMRSTSEALARAAVSGLIAAGANVKDIGLTTTSLFNFAVSAHEEVEAGMMVTASHNPAQYNGLKFANSTGLPISGLEMRTALLTDMPVSAAPGAVETWNVLDEYVAACVATVGVGAARGLRAVVDYGNGMGAFVFRAVARALELEIVELFPEPDPTFPNHEANPVKRETLTALQTELATGKFNIGIAFDGDADRVGFLDELGRPLRGDQTLTLLATDVLAGEPGATVITQPSHTWAIGQTIKALGGRSVEVKVGRTAVVAAMRAQSAALGGEISGHFFFKNFADLEAVDHAVARICHLINKSKKPFSELTAPLFAFANSWEVNFEVSDKASCLKTIEDTYLPAATLVNRLDGIRLEFGQDWWFLVRPSNTEPLLRLIVEARTEAILKEKLAELSAIMHSA